MPPGAGKGWLARTPPPPAGGAPSPWPGEAADVRALGQLLYACLVAHWPGGERFGMPAAPIVEGHWVLPSQVRGGVAPAVDQVVDRLLSPVPRGHASRLTTAQDVTTQLSLVLGPMGAAHDLQARLHPDVDPDTEAAPPVPASLVAPPIPTPASASRFSVHEVIGDETPDSPAAESAASPGPGAQARSASPAGADLPAWAAPSVELSPSAEVSPEEDPYAGEFHYTNAELYGEDDPGDETQPFVDEALRRSESFTPVPPPAGLRPSSGPEQPQRRGRLMPLLFGVLALVVVVGIVAVVAMNVREPAGPAAPAAGAVQIEAATAFDPKADGGDASENSKRATRAIDGDASTIWRTEKYGRAKSNGRKPGVGLVLDLGVVRMVSSVQVTMEDAGATVELRVPAKPAKTAPMKSVEQWESMAAAKDAPKTFTLTPVQPVETRFLLIYLSELPSVAKGVYRGGVAEVVVNAR